MRIESTQFTKEDVASFLADYFEVERKVLLEFEPK